MPRLNRWTRFLGPVLLAGLYSYPAAAQGVSLGAADSALVARVLRAEDRGDSLDPALAVAKAHRDPRLRQLAQRAEERLRDPQFARRDSLGFPPLPAPPTWAEPEWKARYRALAAQRDDCTVMRRALQDPVVPIRLRAIALLRESCASDALLLPLLLSSIDALPAETSTRRRGEASWQVAAQAAVALARLQPDSALPRLRRLAQHPQWEVRVYAARGAALLKNAAILQSLAVDINDNVAEAAIDGLAPIASARHRPLFRAALRRNGAQVVRAGARALATSDDARTRAAAEEALARFIQRRNASERDVRIALLGVLGREPSADQEPTRADTLFPGAVALALGATYYLQVTMDPAMGGGSFTVLLRGDVAPLMSARILALAREGYYDGSSWHRVEHDFVVQGGSPGANEYVGEARALRDELSRLPHQRGTVGMSTRGHDTGDAQWFINLRDNLRLGRDYTVFAEVVEGMEVVDAILEGDRILSVREVRR